LLLLDVYISLDTFFRRTSII